MRHDDDPETRVPIEEASEQDEESAPTGLPPEQQDRGRTVDDDPENQETG
jgi:hypothetical protein